MLKSPSITKGAPSSEKVESNKSNSNSNLRHFLKKTVANKLLNGTTGTVRDILRHHAKQFINVQYFPGVVKFVIQFILE